MIWGGNLMNYSFSSLTGAVLLRADSNSQNTKIYTETGEKDLISEALFWGDELKEGLYYDYEATENRKGYTVPCEGWNDYSEKETEKLSIAKTTGWINSRILNYNGVNLCVIQGYAGCGKTTFVQSLLRKALSKKTDSSYYNFYIGHVRNSSEKGFISSSILSKIVEQIIATLKDDDGFMIYEQFVRLCKFDTSTISSNFGTDFASIYYSESDTSLYTHAKNIYEHRESDNVNEYEMKYRVQFRNSYNSKMGFFRNKDLDTESLEIVLLIDYIWRCAVSLGRNHLQGTNQIVVYDNLDIIDDIQVVVEFIDTLRSVLSNYELFKNENPNICLPTFKAILTVRKITYSSISRFSEVGSNEPLQAPIDIDFLDISNLYIPSNILKHKARILLKNFDSIVPPGTTSHKEIYSFLNKLLDVPDDMFSDIKFSELLNHNLRACANMMELVISSDTYSQHYNLITSTHRVNSKYISGIWIHIICEVLKTKGVWESLGYNLSNTLKPNYPTTLSRMILTYLRNYRMGYMRNMPGYTSSDVSFGEIATVFEKIPFNNFIKNMDWNSQIAPALKHNHNKVNSHKQLIHFIAEMLLRNNSIEATELWRRPIYFTHNAFSVCNSKAITESLELQLENGKPFTSFCITDEGNTFVEKIATHFEFYSVRYNNRVAEPLYYVQNDDRLNELTERVYNQVVFCVEKQIWLMNFYINSTNSTKNTYLNELYHPRTDEFLPQLHIVRTIYDHIMYLNSYRDLICQYQINDDINKSLVKWIGKYLELYRKNFFDVLKDSDGAYNNSIWLDLKYLYWLVISDDNKRGKNFLEGKFITINRKSNISRSEQSNYDKKYRITDEELLSSPMLI